MNARADGTFQPLISEELVHQGIQHLKAHKAQDSTGMSAEALKVLADSPILIARLTELFNDRALQPPCDNPFPETPYDPCVPGFEAETSFIDALQAVSRDNTFAETSSLSYTLDKVRDKQPGEQLEQLQQEHVHDWWQEQLCVLIEKDSKTDSVEQFRPITILMIMSKLYLYMLYALMAPKIAFAGWFQHGARKGFQCLEVVQAIRIAIEKALEWSLALLVLSIDIHKAYDSLCLATVVGILNVYAIPVVLKFAFLKEVLATKKMHMWYDGREVCSLLVNRGFRQGSPEASFLFAVIVGHLLAKLDRKWQLVGCGVKFGEWGGSGVAFNEWWAQHSPLFPESMGTDVQNIFLSVLGFLDDIYFLCGSFEQAQMMLNDAISLFGSVGLRLNIAKISWMANKHCSCPENATLQIGNVLIPRTDSMTILGSVVCINGEEGPALRHRMLKAWGVFHKWSHILTCSAPLQARVLFWARVVLPSLTWGVQTLRAPTQTLNTAFAFCQKLMFRKMMRQGRKCHGGWVEPWLEWHKRTLGAAWNVATKRVNVEHVIQSKSLSWAGHLARLGVHTKEAHVVKFLLAWRPLGWWRDQQVFNLMDYETLYHPFGWGHPRRWEGSMPTDWWLDLSK